MSLDFTGYQNRESAKMFVKSMAADISAQIVTDIKQCGYFSLMTDEGTDRTTEAASDIFVRYIIDGIATTEFLCLIPVNCNASAENIMRLIDETMHKVGFGDWKEYLIGFGCDGASVNTGVRNGIGALVRSSHSYVIVFHCAAHRLELVMKDSFKNHQDYKQLHSLMSCLNKFYFYFPSNWRGFKTAAESIGRVASHPPRVDGTRWIAFILAAVASFIEQWDILVLHLRQVKANPHGQTASDLKAPKASGILSLILFPRMILFSAFLFDILSVLKPLSLAFQSPNANPSSNNKAIRKTFAKLQQLQVDGFPTANEIKQEMRPLPGAQLGKFQYKNEPISFKCGRRAEGRAVVSVEEIFENQRQKALETVSIVIDKMKSRFDLSTKNPVVQHTHILDTAAMPVLALDENGVPIPHDYGNEDIVAFVKHFKPFLERKGCVTATVIYEWQDVKEFVLQQLERSPKLTDSQVWKLVLNAVDKETGHEKFKNFNHVLKIMKIIPTSTADCERGFSMLKRFKSELRNRLKLKFVSDMMSVKLNTVPFKEVDTTPFVESWFNKKARRLNSSASGPHKSNSGDVYDTDDEILEMESLAESGFFG